MRNISILLAFILALAVASPALAMPDQAIRYEVDEPVQLSVAPLDDGSLLFHGALFYEGTNRFAPHVRDDIHNEYDLLNEGYLALMGPDGVTRWTLRFGEPTADNYIWPMGELPDGHLLACLRMYESVMGTQHYAVNMDTGRIEDMLPTLEVARKVPPLTMQRVSGGYVGGGEVPVDDTFQREQETDPAYSHFDGMTVRYLEWDLTERWALDLKPYTRSANFSLTELAGGDILLCGSAVYGDGPADGVICLLRVDGQSGRVLWQYEEEALEGWYQGTSGLAELEDGSIVFTASFSPEVSSYSDWQTMDRQALYDSYRMELCCLDGMDGSLTWTRPIRDGAEGKTSWFTNGLIPFEDGYVTIGGLMADRPVQQLLYLDQEGVIQRALPIDPPQGASLQWASVTASPSGEHVYMYARTCDPEREDYHATMTRDLYYLRLTPDAFR